MRSPESDMIREHTSPEGHPIIILERVLRRYGDTLSLTFSRYQIGPPGDQFSRPRTVFTVRALDLTAAWLDAEIGKLKPDEELAVHSRAALEDEFVHIPMVDFDREIPLATLRELGGSAIRACRFHSPNLNFQEPPRLYLFKTGRSYHQYADVLMLESDWHGFLGDLLLLNPASGQPSVDARWIAHALKRGYAALRWSHNTARYMTMPILVDKFDLTLTSFAWAG
jgi:hypothetical protein